MRQEKKGRSATREPSPKANPSVSVLEKTHTHNLKFDGFAIQLNGSNLEVHPDSADVALCVCVILKGGARKQPEQTDPRTTWKSPFQLSAPAVLLTTKP